LLFDIQLTTLNRSRQFHTLQLLALMFALSDSIPNSAEDGVAGFSILFWRTWLGWATVAAAGILFEDASIKGNGGGKIMPAHRRRNR
jgi:hypothetical protein